MANTQGEKELRTSYDGEGNKGKQIALISEDGTHSFPAKERVGLNE